MSDHKNKGIFVYHFIETYTGRVLGEMRVRCDRVDLRRQPAGAWTSTRLLSDILDGGVDGGLSFSFPDQGAPKQSYGRNVKTEPQDGDVYGSLDGKTIHLGGINGLVEGFDNGNMVMVLTFTPQGFGPPSRGSTVTTMLNNAEPGGTGVVQSGSEGHGDKYIYFGVWTRQGN